MVEDSNFGKGLVYGGIISIGCWSILAAMISLVFM